MKQSTISHFGVVESISNGKISVRISSVSACSSCHAQGSCTAADKQDKIIEIDKVSKNVAIGDWVNVVAKESAGIRAVTLGYLLPFVVLFTTLLTCHLLGISEGISGLFSIAILIPYYLMLYFFRLKIKNAFQFELQ